MRCSKPVDLSSVYPTLVELTGIDAPRQKLDGPSLAPLLRDPNATWEHVALTTYRRGNHTVRDERWRYIRYADGSEELYDHRTPEAETKNVAESQPKVAKELEARIEARLR